MGKPRSFNEYMEDHFTRNPAEIDEFLQECFDEYAKDGDNAALLSQLRVIAKVRGISDLAEEIGMTRQGLQKALSSKGNPRLDTINAIMRALGYRLMPEKIDLGNDSGRTAVKETG